MRGELQALHRQADAYARQEKRSILGTDEQIAATRHARESAAALSQAMQALERSREALYR